MTKLTKPQYALLLRAAIGIPNPYRAEWRAARTLLKEGLVEKAGYANFGIKATPKGFELIASKEAHS